MFIHNPHYMTEDNRKRLAPMIGQCDFAYMSKAGFFNHWLGLMLRSGMAI
jgi:hypothetical protein